MKPPLTAETLSPKCPPLMREFLALYDYNYTPAAHALGVTAGSIGGWARAEKTPSRINQERMRMMIQNKGGESPLSQEAATPAKKKTPEDLMQLVHAVGNPVRVIEMLDIDDPAQFYAVFDGIVEMPPEMAKKVTQALHSKERVEKARKKKGPPRTSVLPPLLAELVTKHHGSVAEASRAIGYKSTTWIMKFADPKEIFTPEDQERVRAALVDEPMRGQSVNGFDKGELGIAIVYCDNDRLSAVFDAGEAMGGVWCFRKRKGAEWTAICKIADKGKLQAFKAVVKLVANEVITP